MNAFRLFLAVITSHLVHLELHAAAFDNLNFEAPRLPLIPNDPQGFERVPIGDAMPGWRGFIGFTEQSLVLDNLHLASSAGIALAGPGPWRGSLVPRNIIDGSYTAYLQSGVGILGGGGGFVGASLSQVGQVPFDALSLHLSIDAFGPFSVILGSQTLDLIPLETYPTYTVYGADISSYAGRTEELRISVEPWFGPYPRGGGSYYSHLWLDSIQFSPLPVPEPGPLALLAGGLAAFGLLRWRRRAFVSDASSERCCSSPRKP